VRYLESPSHDPAFNLALEQHVFDTLSTGEEFFMLWRNRDAVIVGVHQNTAEEIDASYIRQNGIPVVRRLSGGGAVFHDLGNVNFSFITAAPDHEKLDFRFSCAPIIEALAALGVPAETSGRNDITVGGRKISGNARYLRDGKLMHHGTVLFDTDFEKMAAALRVREDKFESKSVKSVRARVTNLREHLPADMTAQEFFSFLRQQIAGKRDMPEYTLTERDLEAVEAIRQKRYAAWAWNYGGWPEYGVTKRGRFEGCGTLRVSLRVEYGAIADFASDGDYFGKTPCRALAELLRGVTLEERALREALSGIPLADYYEGLAPDDFIRLLVE
jgi:lipoate-protein ligase A